MATGVLNPADPGYINPQTGILAAANPDKSVLGYDPAQAQSKDMAATSYQSNPFNVTSDQTVAGQLDKITAADSKLMQQAETRANQAAQSKGLLNSSLAVEAGQNAVIQQALPIAQQDASTYFNANTNTVNAENAAKFQNMQAENAARSQNAAQATNVSQTNAQAVNTASGFGADAANRLQLANVDNAVKVQLATMDNQYRQLLQSSQASAQMFQQVVKNIADISQNATLSRAAKDAAITTQLNNLHEAMLLQQETATKSAQAVGSLNLGQFFNANVGTPDTSATPPANGAERTAADGSIERYNATTKQWVPVNPNSPFPTSTTPAALQDGAVRAKADGTMERYDAATKKWVPISDLAWAAKFYPPSPYPLSLYPPSPYRP